ncbi:N-acyl-phosphatidylethanolamine-hydrolyzing phospholipase D isoform X1 [Hydra vulgaris]|uniref:N-acyl-phosphatidylethanolamine-hydrolyzing phospholipase D isoform X1 n=1 Tax=Hydra vulgaris TaxID=6087 RepID=UPI001F5EE4A5|nr:N-acyl-phosphatidylethanolamine-hydrolyzing phospholipase D [Hydra vulgaris]
MSINEENKSKPTSVQKKTIKVISKRDKDEYPRAEIKDGKYVLPWKTDEVAPDVWNHLKSIFSLDSSEVPKVEKLNEVPLMQLSKPDPQLIANPPENGIRVTWLGHATALFQMDSVNILINPNFKAKSTKRYRPPVYTVEQLPRIDCVFITNTHVGYLDLSSIKQLIDRFGEMLLWYVPMGMCDWMTKAGCVNIVEMDWWNEDEIHFIDQSTKDNEEETKTTVFNIACTPSQSYHNRSFDDDNAVLWCSWVIRSPRYKIFISGSTGYANVFQCIGKKYGPFHMAALPIGGYDPKSRNGYSNLTPEQAIQVHKDIFAVCSLALSWGTFTFSNEHYLEPPQRLNEELKKSNMSVMQFFLLKHGESRIVEIKETDGENNDIAIGCANDLSSKKVITEDNIVEKVETELLQELVDDQVNDVL